MSTSGRSSCAWPNGRRRPLLRRSVAATETIAPVLNILLVTFPFFALVLAGFWAARPGAPAFLYVAAALQG